MKILKARWKPLDPKYNALLYAGGEEAYKGNLELLIDKFPEIKFKKYGSFLYGEKDGYVHCYKHEPGSTDGFAGRSITITFEDGTEKIYKGSLWDASARKTNVPEHYSNISITTDPKVWKKGYTFYACKLTKELYEKIIKEIKEKGEINNVQNKNKSRNDMLL